MRTLYSPAPARRQREPLLQRIGQALLQDASRVLVQATAAMKRDHATVLNDQAESPNHAHDPLLPHPVLVTLPHVPIRQPQMHDSVPEDYTQHHAVVSAVHDVQLGVSDVDVCRRHRHGADRRRNTRRAKSLNQGADTRLRRR